VLSSPLMTVAVLAVLWLIVVVPMVVRRNDERRRDRSVAGFGKAMRLLGRRVHGSADPSQRHSDVFVPRDNGSESAAAATPARRPIPAAREAHMHPVDRSEMSASRTQMMARRRRSLTILGAGSAVFTLLALLMGGMMWVLAAPFVLGLGGYLYFLRSQALRDRDRRDQRQQRAARRTGPGYDATQEMQHFAQAPTAVVNIDDDDLELHNLDTVDLTGLYNDEHSVAAEEQRRAS
jgi:membrane protein implicated in regulation of membrane protease activity